MGNTDTSRTPRTPSSGPEGHLILAIGRLAFEERDAIARRDWPSATSKARERLYLQETRHRFLAQRRS